jgi:hypothetical protein|eukprot:COSAG01_NODE_4531_length_4948_cov_5.839905_6_plen_39_part_00
MMLRLQVAEADAASAARSAVYQELVDWRERLPLQIKAL